jgi:hypothetical protein
VLPKGDISGSSVTQSPRRSAVFTGRRCFARGLVRSRKGAHHRGLVSAGNRSSLLQGFEVPCPGHEVAQVTIVVTLLSRRLGTAGQVETTMGWLSGFGASRAGTSEARFGWGVRCHQRFATKPAAPRSEANPGRCRLTAAQHPGCAGFVLPVVSLLAHLGWSRAL